MDGVIPGRIVHYVISEADAAVISNRRIDGAPYEMTKGVQMSFGNPIKNGDHLPMIMTAVFQNEYGEGIPGVNGQVVLDGSDTFWITSKKYSELKEPGTWHWIEKA